MKLNLPSSMLAPHLSKTDPLCALLYSAAHTTVIKAQKNEIFWNSAHYGLDQSKLFVSLSEIRQFEILKNLNHSSLSLSYYIEKFGMNYGAKMILDADSIEEKSLYSLFVADEARHRLAIESFISDEVTTNINFHPLLPALNTALNNGCKEAIVFSIQVILEGFGLTYYSYLKESCLSPALQKEFDTILKDEVLHHGMGVQLTQRMNLDDNSKNQITELTALFVRALLDADLIIQTTEKEFGGFTQQERQNFLNDLDWSKRLNLRIERLKSLLRKVGYQGLSENLETKGVFKIS